MEELDLNAQVTEAWKKVYGGLREAAELGPVALLSCLCTSIEVSADSFHKPVLKFVDEDLRPLIEKLNGGDEE